MSSTQILYPSPFSMPNTWIKQSITGGTPPEPVSVKPKSQQLSGTPSPDVPIKQKPEDTQDSVQLSSTPSPDVPIKQEPEDSTEIVQFPGTPSPDRPIKQEPEDNGSNSPDSGSAPAAPYKEGSSGSGPDVPPPQPITVKLVVTEPMSDTAGGLAIWPPPPEPVPQSNELTAGGPAIWPPPPEPSPRQDDGESNNPPPAPSPAPAVPYKEVPVNNEVKRLMSVTMVRIGSIKV